ncbi:MAG TPA: aminotransferase class IV [Pirellulales bacterium]|nr:aminotransferase class IV [Pirellulales bacterium]
MSQRIVYFNGEFVPEAQARLSIYDSALTMGDMAFEVTRTVHGRPFRLDDHLARLYHTLGVLRIDPGLSPAALRVITEQTLGRNLPTEPAEVDWNVIHNISRGPMAANFAAFAPHERRPTVIVSCFPLVEKLGSLSAAYETGIDAVVPAQRSIPGDLLDDSLKTRSRLHYQLANLQANEIQPGAWAILTDPAGHLTEGTSGNVFVVRHGALMTPRADNLLPGITRQMVLELAGAANLPVFEDDITPAQALDSEEMFMTSTSIGILHVRRFAGRLIGSGGIGPITARLRASLCDAVGLDFAAQAARYAELRGAR